jgi:hypothetical protein
MLATLPGSSKRDGNVSDAYVIVTAVTTVANIGVAAADFRGVRFVLANMDEVGVPRSWLTPLGLLKAAGAAGLLLGLFGLRSVGIAAATGLVVFFPGALAAHVRAHVFHKIAFAGAFLEEAVASTVLAAAA